MRHLISDFASRDFASRATSERRQRLVFCVLSCAILALATGCSTLGSLGGSGDDLSNPERLSDAMAVAKNNGQLEPSQPYWPYRVGELYVAADSLEQAINNLQRALRIDASYAPAAGLLSKIYYEGAMYNAGATLLGEFISLNTDAPDALRAALALHLEALGDVDGAQSALRDCSGDSQDVRAALTFVTLRGDDPQSALDSAEQALSTDGNSAANHNNYGIALLCAGRPIEARSALMKALKLNDALPGALYNMAIIEAFYFFNEEAGREWFDRYRQYASEDPDDLGSVFGTEVGAISNPSNEE